MKFVFLFLFCSKNLFVKLFKANWQNLEKLDQTGIGYNVSKIASVFMLIVFIYTL